MEEEAEVAGAEALALDTEEAMVVGQWEEGGMAVAVEVEETDLIPTETKSTDRQNSASTLANEGSVL